ncbi:META domain-containing protein, partial [Klebsiella pneumoniae]|nr:META domain-containing protein [Klebsiella pneumoniae]
GTATVSGSTIKIGPIRSTLMLCEGPGGDTETAYFAALPNAATFTATADALTLYDSSGKSILVYAVGAANPIEGFWNVT